MNNQDTIETTTSKLILKTCYKASKCDDTTLVIWLKKSILLILAVAILRFTLAIFLKKEAFKKTNILKKWRNVFWMNLQIKGLLLFEIMTSKILAKTHGEDFFLPNQGQIKTRRSMQKKSLKNVLDNLKATTMKSFLGRFHEQLCSFNKKIFKTGS